ncbi:LmeA family phospholipid-binding protein [Streptomyces alkaliterrae]|uniref:DUF2993 domain-containing protein n=1 Tax=Streptomyces alkaliterrae TaxID=2213162 RepID=A0A5P0YTR2_9ACTN|nr:DUF2993 domain-containing protein [Streptomyces alkaliterrae]MBB1256494.1 DUF2993 domain-containing protein [Streptomyces alkaliterrae]MBB1257602.1 DUF2993 domain-containing protein [Streptomyces alkaliterrae]MQS03703.1 DUF2993 domain-containing protein [Streptomyces alkaliterrae]
MRALRITLIVLLVLAGLFTGADRLAVKLVEDRLEDRLAASQNASGAEVSIKGFPFLTQVAAKRLDAVDARLTGLTARSGEQALRVNEFEIQARDISVSGDFNSAVATSATGTAHLTYQDLTEAADEGVTVAYAGGTAEGEAKVRVTGKVTVPLLNQQLERSTTSTITVEEGDTLRLRADAIPGANVPGLEDLVRNKIDYTRQIDGLPAGVSLTSVTADKDGVDLHFTGQDVSVTG